MIRKLVLTVLMATGGLLTVAMGQPSVTVEGNDAPVPPAGSEVTLTINNNPTIDPNNYSLSFTGTFSSRVRGAKTRIPPVAPAPDNSLLRHFTTSTCT